ncbi:MAG: DUF1080 domain-containing protein [Planctomycetota bacterium]|nr:DUF1080 domain-containing protein [Planctomycetaceae bacterium]MDQ3331695.1 DUF1080 domain-containing protein [Planctomycetota bacterium]
MSCRIAFAWAACLFSASGMAAEPVRLFNGADLTGWKMVLDDPKADPAKTWSVRDGVLHCTGTPRGYLRTDKDGFKNYRLHVEWRWPEGTPDNANNGVLAHVTTPNALGVWPKSLEVQLANGNAGDFWVIPGDDGDDPTTIDVPLKGVPGENRFAGRRHFNFTDGSEKPVGEWNTMEIVCRDDTIAVKVNDEIVNYAFDCSVTEGAIALQSEGAPIEYRAVILTSIEGE